MFIASSIKINIFVFDLEEHITQSTHYYKDQKIGYWHDLYAEHNVLKKLNIKRYDASVIKS